MPQRYTDKIIQQADQALEALGNEFVQNAPLTESAVLEIEFGSADIPVSRLPSLSSGTILTLNVLNYGGRPAAEGILMIQDGVIAVKITRKYSRPD